MSTTLGRKQREYGPRRKQIIIDLYHGLSQSEAARRNGCSRQFVHVVNNDEKHKEAVRLKQIRTWGETRAHRDA